jgi:hypothetical protein
MGPLGLDREGGCTLYTGLHWQELHDAWNYVAVTMLDVGAVCLGKFDEGGGIEADMEQLLPCCKDVLQRNFTGVKDVREAEGERARVRRQHPARHRAL